MSGTFARAAIALALALSAGAAFAQAALSPAPAVASTATAPPENDYNDPANWLCRPGRTDACRVDLDATVIQANGTTSPDRFRFDPDAPIDCFYVYPTVSTDPGVNATMAIEPAETNAVLHQFARFGAKCRLYAPMYRQITLAALAATVIGQPIAPANANLAYADIQAAWADYLARDNHGRGVVLIGHSQGSDILIRLIRDQIQGKPVQKQLVSAILMGTALQVPAGKDVGGDLASVPLCHSVSQVGCAIAYSSFRADSPPPQGSVFGQIQAELVLGCDRHGPCYPPEEGAKTVAACVNPAALGGGSGELKAYFTVSGRQIVNAASAQPAWITPEEPFHTEFVETPGLLSAECMFDTHGNYLAITVHPTPGGRRANDIGGDLVFGGQVQKTWGLLLMDADLNMGNLIDIVGDESKAYLAQAGK